MVIAKMESNNDQGWHNAHEPCKQQIYGSDVMINTNIKNQYERCFSS